MAYPCLIAYSFIGATAVIHGLGLPLHCVIIALSTLGLLDVATIMAA